MSARARGGPVQRMGTHPRDGCPADVPFSAVRVVVSNARGGVSGAPEIAVKRKDESPLSSSDSSLLRAKPSCHRPAYPSVARRQWSPGTARSRPRARRHPARTAERTGALSPSSHGRRSVRTRALASIPPDCGAMQYTRHPKRKGPRVGFLESSRAAGSPGERRWLRATNLLLVSYGRALSAVMARSKNNSYLHAVIVFRIFTWSGLSRSVLEARAQPCSPGMIAHVPRPLEPVLAPEA